MALYPDTSCFYRAEVIATPKELQPSSRVRKLFQFLKIPEADNRRPCLLQNICQVTNSSLRTMITRSTLSLHSGLLNGQVIEESSLCLIMLNILYDVINSLECAGLHTHSGAQVTRSIASLLNHYNHRIQFWQQQVISSNFFSRGVYKPDTSNGFISITFTMSIARQLLHEFRPFFRMLDEPFGRRPSHFVPAGSRLLDWNHPFTDPFEGLNILARPAVDVTEKGNKYILDADLPGVSKENLQVRLGDGNQSITIEGKVTEKLSSGVHNTNEETKSAATDTASSPEYTDGMSLTFDHECFAHSREASHSTSKANSSDNATQIAVERPYARNYSFTRTVWLPRPVDPSSIVAKLQNGVLSISLQKGVHEKSKVINVEEN